MQTERVEFAVTEKNYPRAEIRERDKRTLHANLHYGRVKRQNTLGFGKIFGKIVTYGSELLRFVIFANVSLNHAHTLYVFLNGLVHRVVTLEKPPENRHSLIRNHRYTETEERYGYKENHGKSRTYEETHNDRENQHKRTSYSGADKHHKSKLHVGNIRRKTSNERRRTELIYV